MVADYLSRYGLKNQKELDISEWEKQAVEFVLESPEESIDLHAIEEVENTTDENIPIHEYEDHISTAREDIIENVDTENEDPNFQFSNPYNLQWTDIMEIKGSLLEQESLPYKYLPIMKFFTTIDEKFYFIQDQSLLTVITDDDFYNQANELHKKFHSSHRALKVMMLEDQFWNPNLDVIITDIVRTCPNCEMFQ